MLYFFLFLLCFLLPSIHANVDISETFVKFGPFAVDGVTAMMTKEVTMDGEDWLKLTLLDNRHVLITHPSHELHRDLDNLQTEARIALTTFKRKVRANGLHLDRCEGWQCVDEVSGADSESRRKGWTCLEWTCPENSRGEVGQKMGIVYQH